MTDKSVTVKLSKPIRVGAKEKAELIFSEPTLSDLIDAEGQIGDGGQHKMTALLMARMAGISLSEIGQLSVADYAKCDKDLRPLLGNLAGGTGGE